MEDVSKESVKEIVLDGTDIVPIDQEVVLGNGTEQEAAGTSATPAPIPVITNGSTEPECIDLTMDMDEEEESGAVYYSDIDIVSDSESVDSQDGQIFKFEWAAHPDQYPLYHNNKEFKKLAGPYADLLMRYGQECVNTCWRAHYRWPSVDEFWNYVMSKFVPRVGWVGVWKLVNSERRGWPLQYIDKAEIIIKNIAFRGLSTPKIDMKILKVFDPTYQSKQKLDGVSLWQIDILRTNTEFYPDKECEGIQEGQEILKLARQFYDTMFVPPDSDLDDITAYFGPVFYERLELLFYMENATPYQGTLSVNDRGKIVAAIKQYHFFKNALVDCSNVSLLIDGDETEIIDGRKVVPDMMEDAEYSENVKKYILLQMQLDRHRVELNFLMKASLRPLISALPQETDTFENYQHIIVMRETSLAGLNAIMSKLQQNNVENIDNIRICTDLEQALRNCRTGANIFVASGNYAISGLHNLCHGGALIGVETDESDVTITPSDDIGDVWLLYSGYASTSKLVIKNINFIVETSDNIFLECCLQVTSGRLEIQDSNIRNTNNNCDANKFIAGKKSKEAEIVVENCNFNFVE